MECTKQCPAFYCRVEVLPDVLFGPAFILTGIKLKKKKTHTKNNCECRHVQRTNVKKELNIVIVVEACH